MNLKLELIVILTNLASSSCTFSPNGDGSCPPQTGYAGCQCITPNQNSQVYSFTENNSTKNISFANNQGATQCDKWDQYEYPQCRETEKVGDDIGAQVGRDQCELKWCWVNRDSCAMDDITPSQSFPLNDPQLFFSQKACGFEYDFAIAHTSQFKTAEQIMVVMENYVKNSKINVEEIINEASPSCPCKEFDHCKKDMNFCSQSGRGQWGDFKLNFGSARSLIPSTANMQTTLQNKYSCLNRQMRMDQTKVSRSEYNDKERIAYQYTGWQTQGQFVEWPYMEYCDTGFDPRFRPWYAVGASGPKDVVIVIDVSGSMATAGRMQAAVDAALEVLDTLTQQDYVAVVKFNNSASSQASNLMPMTKANKTVVANQVSSFVEGGGTNFQAGFGKAFEIINSSISSGNTSGCAGAILFLTDGVDASTLPSYVSDNNQHNFIVFSYIFGANADASFCRSVSCDSNGVQQQIADGGNLKDAMAGYFRFFANLNPNTSVPKVRWHEYNDFITNEVLLAACIPIYSTDSGVTNFEGVTCKDVNIIIDLTTLKTKSDQNTMYTNFTNETKTCVALQTNDAAKLDHARWMVSGFKTQCATPVEVNTQPSESNGSTDCTMSNLSGQAACDEVADVYSGLIAGISLILLI